MFAIGPAQMRQMNMLGSSENQPHQLDARGKKGVATKTGAARPRPTPAPIPTRAAPAPAPTQAVRWVM